MDAGLWTLLYNNNIFQIKSQRRRATSPLTFNLKYIIIVVRQLYLLT